MDIQKLAAKKVSRARAALILSSPFFATLALSMGAEEVGGDVTKTMATDGKSLFYNAQFVLDTPDDELRGVIVHEVLHVAYLHHTRRGNRDPKLWNVATDYIINANVIREGFKLPSSVLHDPVRFPFDMSSEAVYAILAKEQDDGAPQPDPNGQPGQGQGQGQGQGDVPGQIGDVLDAAPGDAAATAIAEMEAKTRVINAAKAAAASGKGSDLSRRLLDEARTSPRDIWSVLQRYVDSASRKTPTWSTPNRRHVHAGLYVPGSMRDGMSKLAIIIDVSGSIDEDKLATFIRALNDAVAASAPEEIDVIQCDTKITSRRTFYQDETIKVDVVGGGGTNMNPALAKVKDAAACIVFTDCEFGRQPIDPGVPVLWARWGNGPDPSFGEVIDVA